MFKAFKSIFLEELKLHKSNETANEILEKLENREASSSIESDEVIVEEEDHCEADDEQDIELKEELTEKELEVLILSVRL